MRLPWRVGVIVSAGLAALGCARFPGIPDGEFTKRLVFTLTVDRELRDGQGQATGLPYVYIVALNLSRELNPTVQGPIPITVPSGNGIVAGNATHFILWNPLASPQFQIFQFRDATLNESFQTGVPLNFSPVNTGDRSLSFEIDLAQLVPAADVPNIQSVQANFLTMNNTNTSGSGRLWDGLGDGNDPTQINDFITFNLRSSRTFTNANQGNIEPRGDVADPDLDLVDWSIEVRLR